MPKANDAVVAQPAKQPVKQPTKRSAKRPVKQPDSQESLDTHPSSPIPVPVSTAETAKLTDSAIDKAVFLRKYAENALQQAKEGSPEDYHKLVKLFAYSRRASPLT
ncbi:hypothetical protein H4R20_000535, partial [Coemansia guatemalensis]